MAARALPRVGLPQTMRAMVKAPMRSKLFVPASRPDVFAKALAGDADALSFDLEDAVPAGAKAEARARLAAFLAAAPCRTAGKTAIVRVNAPGSGEWLADLQAVLALDVDLVNLPKIESPVHLLAAVADIERVESALPAPLRPGLLVNIETPRALRAAADIAAAHPRVRGLQLGLGDLFEPYGIRRGEPRNVHAAQYALRLAAAEAGVFACDGAFPGLRDEPGFRCEAESARALGFVGKSCVHPVQVAWANAVFMPTAAEIEAARRIVEQAGEGDAGVFAVDGRMVDAPYLARARSVLAQARGAGDGGA